MVSVIAQYIPKAKIQLLRHREIFTHRGIDFQGICFDNESITNEDDVMTLAISNHEELLFAEIDTLIPKTEEAHEILYRLFVRKSYARVTYLSSRNELGANLPILDISTDKERQKFRKQYRSSRKKELEWDYVCLVSGEYTDFTQVPNFARGYIGQGMCYPSRLDPVLSQTTAMNLSEIAELENSIAQKYGKDFPSSILTAGSVFETTNIGLKPTQAPTFL